MRWSIFAFVAAVSVLFGTSADASERRIALVLGNSVYQHEKPLFSAAHDAAAVGATLVQLGFEVTNAANVGLADMWARIHEISTKVATSPSDTVALIFYAGRGAEVNGDVFLIPIDARIEQDSDFSSQAVSLSDLLLTLDAEPSQITIVIFDASRAIPFARHGITIVDAPDNTLIAFATAPGSDALDGSGATSPYATALVAAMKEPGLPIELVFKKVRDTVHRATDGKQTPWESDSLSRRFMFVPATP